MNSAFCLLVRAEWNAGPSIIKGTFPIDQRCGDELQPCLVTGWRLHRFLAGVVTRPDRYRDRTPARRTGANSERDQGINAAGFALRPVLVLDSGFEVDCLPNAEKRRACLGLAFILDRNRRADRVDQPAK